VKCIFNKQPPSSLLTVNNHPLSVLLGLLNKTMHLEKLKLPNTLWNVVQTT